MYALHYCDMNHQQYQRLRVMITLFIFAIVLLAVDYDSYLLASAAIFTGMLFMSLVRSKARIKIDEREKSIREKAAQLTYAIFAPTIGIGAFLLLFPSHSGLTVFAKGEFTYLESIGIVFAYLTLFLIVLYAISYHFLNRKYGGGSDQK